MFCGSCLFCFIFGAVGVWFKLCLSHSFQYGVISMVLACVALEEVTCNLINCLHWDALRIIYALDSEKQSTGLHCTKTKWSQWTQQRYHLFLISHIGHFFFFRSWHLHYPQCNLATEWHDSRQIIRLKAASSGATKGFIRLFYACSLNSNKNSQTHLHA